MPAAALPAIIGGGLGLVGSVIGSNSQNHAAQQAQNAANTAAQGQNQLDSQLVNIYNQMAADYQKNYQPLEGPMGQMIGGMEGSFNPQALDQLTLGALTNPQERDALTGVPLQGITNGALNYFFNPGGTLSGVNGVGGQGLNYFANLAQNGMDPAVANNAYNNFSNNEQQSINSMRNSLGAGVPNVSGMLNDLNEQALQGRANLGSNLAAQDQGIRTQGMTNLLQTAGGIDQQTQAMLQQAYNMANQQSQQGVSNLQSAFGNGNDILSMIQNYIGQGRNILPGVASGIGGLANQYAQAGSSAAQNAQNLSTAAGQNNPFTALGNVDWNSIFGKH